MDRGDKPRDDIEEPAAISSQRPFRSRVGEEEQGARAAPDDLLTSYPGLGAKAPCSVASAPARALVWSAHRPWPSTDTRHRHIRTPHWRLDGLSTSQARLRTAAPGSCAERRFQDRRRLVSEARALRHRTPSASCVVRLQHEPRILSPPSIPSGFDARPSIPLSPSFRGEGRGEGRLHTAKPSHRTPEVIPALPGRRKLQP